MAFTPPNPIKGLSKYSDLIGLGALLISIYFAGSFLEGERLAARELKADLQDVEQATEQILLEVDAINQRLAEEDLKLVQQIEGTYGQLNQLNEKELEARKGLERRWRRTKKQKKQNSDKREQMRQEGGFKFRN